MFVVDTLIYIFFAYVMFLYAKKSYLLYQNNAKIDKYLWLYIAFFTIISSIRWRVGVDTYTYAEEFITGISGNDANFRVERNEIAMTWLVHTVHNLGLHFTVGMGILAFLQIFFITKSALVFKPILIFVPIAMFGSCYFLDLMNAVRQMIVACGFLWFSKFIYEKKFIKYVVCVLLFSYIHSSAIILLPFYFILQSMKLSDKKKLMLCIYTACFVIGLSPQFQGLIKFAENIAELSGYSDYTVRVGGMLSGETSETRSLGPMQLSYLMIGYFIIIYGTRLRKKYGKAIMPFNVWYNSSFIYGCGFFLMANTSHLLIRIFQYFELFQMLMLSLLLYDFWLEHKSRSKKHALYIILVFTIWFNTSWNMLKSNNFNTDPMGIENNTYKFFFMHMDEINKIK